MKRIFPFLTLFLLFAATSYASFADLGGGSGGGGGCTKQADCSTVIAAGTCCVNTGTGVLYGGNGSSAVAQGSTVVNGSKWYNVSGGAPSAGTGVNGDYCLRTDNGAVYTKAGGAWSSIGNITGTTGNTGTAGCTVLYGTVAPTTEGKDCDFYIRTTTNYIYGPKATTWPAGVSLVGATGATGAAGTNGVGIEDTCTPGSGDCGLTMAVNTVTPVCSAGTDIATLGLGASGVLYTCFNGTATAIGSGGGDLFHSGTPANHQIGVFTSGTEVKGVAITASRAMVTNANGEPAASATTATELGYLSGATSGIQAQINGLASSTGYVAPPTYSDSTCTAHTWSMDTSNFYWCPATNTWEAVAKGTGILSATPTPTLATATVSGAEGTTWTYVYNEAVQAATTAALCNAYTSTWTVAGAVTQAYASGTGTDTIVCTGSPAVGSGDTVSAGLDYTQGTIVAASNGTTALANISGHAVINSSGLSSCGVTDSQETDSSNQNVGNTTNTQYAEGTFTANGNATIKTVSLFVKDVGSPTGLTVALCTSSGGNPATCTDADAVLTGTSGTASWQHVNFTAGYAITASTVYHIRVYYPTDAGNYYIVRYYNTVTGQNMKQSPDATTWTSIDLSSQIEFRLSTCED